MGFERSEGVEPVFLPERLMESCEDDAALAREVLEDFQMSVPASLSRLDAAIEAADSGAVRMVAHSLKGSSRTIGAEALAAVCARLETACAHGDLSDARVRFVEARQRFQDLSSILSAYPASRSNGL